LQCQLLLDLLLTHHVMNSVGKMLSDLSHPSFTSNEISEENDNTSSSPTTQKSSKYGGETKGSTKSDKTKDMFVREDVISHCAILYNEERKKACES
jgi:hypothetical protein